MIQLKRFKFDEKTNQIKKLDCHVAFSQVLKIDDASSGRQSGGGGAAYYKIKAAIIHLGKDIHFGHYIALVLHDNLWFKYNDNDVSVAAGLPDVRRTQAAHDLRWGFGSLCLFLHLVL